jgi:hypothetical protein
VITLLNSIPTNTNKITPEFLQRLKQQASDNISSDTHCKVSLLVGYPHGLKEKNTQRKSFKITW